MTQRIPSHYGRFRRWWYTRFPLRDHQLCPVTKWHHRWCCAAWGDVTCNACGTHGYIEYGR